VAVDLETTPLVMDGLAVVGSIEEADAGNRRFHFDAKARKLYVRCGPRDPPTQHTIHVLRDAVGLSLNGSRLVVDGLAFSGFADYGIAVGAGRHVVVRNCRFTLCGVAWGGGVALRASESAVITDCTLFSLYNGVVAAQAVGTEMAHNTIFRTRAHGIILQGGRDNRIRNNILFAGGPSGSALYVGKNAAEGLRVDYNCYLDYKCSALIGWMPGGKLFPTFWDYRAAVPEQDRHSFCDDPLFVSIEPGREDLRLRPGSPCRGRASDGADIGVRHEEGR